MRLLSKAAPASILLFLLAGCADLEMFQPQPDKTRFYFLESDVVPGEEIDPASDGVAVLVGPSSVAKYLDQSNIVTIRDSNEIEYSDLHRWGEPLEESVNRLLIYHLGYSLDTSKVGFMRVMGEFDWDYRVGYHIYELGGQLGGSVQMKIGWWIVSRDGSSSNYEGSIYRGSVGGDRFGDYVDAIEELILRWSDDVSKELANLAAQPRANSTSTSGSEPTKR